MIGTISCFTRSLFSDDVGFAVDYVLGMSSSAPALTSVDLFSLSLVLGLVWVSAWLGWMLIKAPTRI